MSSHGGESLLPCDVFIATRAGVSEHLSPRNDMPTDESDKSGATFRKSGARPRKKNSLHAHIHANGPSGNYIWDQILPGNVFSFPSYMWCEHSDLAVVSSHRYPTGGSHMQLVY
jgi:hypothetical protein